MKRVFNWRPSLLTSFSLVGGFITIVIAAVFAWALQYQLEQNALRQEAASAADQVSLILSPSLNLTLADLSAPLTPADYARIDTLARQDLLHGHIVRVKIWNRAGKVLYSDLQVEVGQVPPMSDELKAALGGQVAMEVSNLSKVENVGERQVYSRLIEVYVPIRLSGSDQVAGAYEIYHDLALLEPNIAATRRFVWISVGLSFLVLYGALFTLVRNASRELIRRNEENQVLYRREQISRAELSALYDLSRGLANTLDFEKALALVTRRAVETVHVTFSRVALLESGRFVVRAVYPIRSLNPVLEVGEPDTPGFNQFCTRVLEQNLPVVISVDSANLSDGERESLAVGSAQTMCLVPLRTGERALGVLMLGEARGTDREPFSSDKLRLASSIGDQAASALYRVELFAQLEKSYLDTVVALASAVDAKDAYTADHAQRMAEMALAIGQEMGITGRDLDGLRYGAILHDIGKIGVPDAILLKPGPLDSAEWAQMHKHPRIGAGILAPLPHLASAAQIVLHHHERYDGKGYPDGLVGDAIPLGARILTVVDTYVAIRDRRVYKTERPHVAAVAELRKHTGTQFDPKAVDVFLKLFEDPEKVP